MNTPVFYTISISLLTAVALAETPAFNDHSKLPPINLTNAIESVLKKHPQALISRENVEVARQEARGAKADLLPNLNANYNYSESQNPVSLGLGQSRVGLAGVSVSQSIFNLPAFHSYKAAQLRLKAAAASADNSDLRLAAAAAGTYFDVLKIRLSLDIAVENYYSIQALIEEMKNGALRSTAKPEDIRLAEAVLGNAMEEKHRAMRDSGRLENFFYRDTRLVAQDFFLLEPTPLSIPETGERAAQVALENNPGLASAQAQLDAAERSAKAARAGYLPRVDVIGSGYQIQRPAGDFKGLKMMGATAGVAVTIPLFDGKRNANVAGQNAKQRISGLQVQDQVVNLKTNLENTYIEVRERELRLKGLCEGLRNRLMTVESMRSQVLQNITIQDLLFQRQELVKNAVALSNEFLSEVLDTYNIQIQMGTLLQSLPPARDVSRPSGLNPQPQDAGVYRGLIDRCSERYLI